MYDILSQDVMYLKGVGPHRAKVLNKELGISSLKDLLYYFPHKYIDRSRIYRINELQEGMATVQVVARIKLFNEEGRGRKRRLEALCDDGTGVVKLVWFGGVTYIRRHLQLDRPYLIFGKPSVFNHEINIVQPEMTSVTQTADLQSYAKLRPVYSITEPMRSVGLTSNVMEQIIGAALSRLGNGQIAETLPPYLITRHHLMGLDEALHVIHSPENMQRLPEAQRRLKFEELFYVQLDIVHYAAQRSRRYKGFVFSRIGDKFLGFYHHNLPFELTGAQKRVIREIRHDLGSGIQMNRLLQGDVGSGKTIVATMTMLIALDNGYQACLLAPTEILAEQHYATVSRLLHDLGIRVELLTGAIQGKRRQHIIEGIADGGVHIIIGTHAILYDAVVFRNLGLAVIDEQHRFGVEQRAKLWLKNDNPPHVLVMTATPIPRTLAMTVYGDLSVSVIDELPPGRKAIETRHVYENSTEQLVNLVRHELEEGRQAYFVYPLIKESEKSDLKDLEAGFKRVGELFPEMRVGKMHGKMKDEEKNAIMDRFKRGELQILVSTTVIEVGVDVPNASVMVIENANRFGLAQLHQLRGRVGRGAKQSYCLLVTGYKLSDTSRKRLEIMTDSTDGFEIAEEDLKLRGPGDLEGTQQSGIVFDLKLANVIRDSDLLEEAREAATQVVKSDPDKNLPQNQVLWAQLAQRRKTNVNWSEIS